MDLLNRLLKKLEENTPLYNMLNLYATGMQPLSFLSPASYAALDRRFGRIASNIPKLAVTSLSERLRITGFEGEDLWDDWISNDLDQLSGTANREALVLGQSFVIVWGEGNTPRVSIESAEQVCVERDPATREVTAALKRYSTPTETHAFLYLPDEIQHWVAPQSNAMGGFIKRETIPNPLGVVPVVPLTNADRLLDVDGRSEIEDLRPLVDGLNKTLADLAVAQEHSSRMRRWATGIELVEKPVLDTAGAPVLDGDGLPVVETVNPLSETSRVWVSENEQAKFGQLEGADLAGFEAAVRIWLGQIMAVSSLPAHMIGILHDQPTSADSLRAAEASLTARAESKQRLFGRSWETVARLMVAVRSGRDASIRVVWSDPATRSTAQEADAAVKLYQAGILSRTAVLRKLGFSDSEVDAELENAVHDATIGANVKLGKYISDLTN